MNVRTATDPAQGDARSMSLYSDTLRSPLGDIVVISDECRLFALDFVGFEARMTTLLRRYYGAVTLTKASNVGGFCRAVQAYVDGDLDVIATLAVAEQGTPFQNQVWRALRRIPVGQTRTYGELARALGRPQASRAVGLANGSNPIAIVVPCHRVIGANGNLTGYAGGLERKRWLLSHEGALLL